MKVRLALIDDDEKFALRFMTFCEVHLKEKIEMSWYDTLESFKERMALRTVDIVLVSATNKSDISSFSEKMPVAYLSDTRSIGEINNIKAMCKYQKPEELYRQILEYIAEQSKGDVRYKLGSIQKARIEGFMSVSGGAGATTIAIAHAKRLARKGVKVLYLNLELIGTTSLFFYASGEKTFEDVIYALRSKRANLALKLESCVRQDRSGVDFFMETNEVTHMEELYDNDVVELLNEISNMGKYEVIVVDMALNIGTRLKEVSKLSDKFYLITTSGKTEVRKLENMTYTIQRMEDSKVIDIIFKLMIVCNKSRQDEPFEYNGKIAIGEFIPRFDGLSQEELVEQMAEYALLENSK